jgi:hypothetical protein
MLDLISLHNIDERWPQNTALANDLCLKEFNEQFFGPEHDSDQPITFSHMRYLSINAAVDKSLTPSIFETLSKAKPINHVPIEILELNISGGIPICRGPRAT